MRSGGARTRLAVLALGVLGAHALLLGAGPQPRFTSSRPPAWVVRSITQVMPAAQAMEVPTPPAAAQAAPGSAMPRAPAPAQASAKPRPLARVDEARRAFSSADAPALAQDAPATQAERPALGAGAEAGGVLIAAAGPDTAVATPKGQAGPRPSHFKVHPAAVFHYHVVASAKGFELQGEGELEWKREGDTYEARLTARAPLIRAREQRSSGLVTAQGLAPVRFSDRSRSEEAAHFQREAGKVSFSNNQPDVPLEPGAQDRLSIIMQLGAILAGEPRRHPAGSTITVQTVSTHDAEPWVFTVEGDDGLKLPGGAVQATKLVRNPRREYDTKVELWLAPGQDYAPVRLRLTQPNGDWVDQQWSGTDR